MTASTESFERASTGTPTGGVLFVDIDFDRLATWYCPRCGSEKGRDLTMEIGALVCNRCDGYSPDVGPRKLNEHSETYMGRMMRAWVAKERKRLRKVGA